MYMGLDLGTSGIKAVLLSTTGQLVAQTTVSLPISHPKPLWSEQDPGEWWHACVKAVGLLRHSSADLSGVEAIGLSGQMHGATLVDVDGQPLRPCILWNDGRSYAQCAELEKRLSDFRTLSGNLAMPGFTAPKLLWVAREEPERFSRIHKVLLPKDYVRFRLTGEFATDLSDAAGTLWLNPAERAWSKRLIEACDLGIEHMPALFEGNEVTGVLSPAAAAELNMPRVPVVAGAGDNAAGAVGMGITEQGQAFLSLGTSGVYFAVSDRHQANPNRTVHAFCHCLPNRWNQMSVALSAASCLAWLADVTNTPAGDLLSELDARNETSTDVTFLPYLSGERTPHNDPHARGVFFGIGADTRRTDLTLAVLEGVAYAFADGQDALEAAGTNIDEVTLIGGGARSRRWRQLLADVLGRPLTFRDGGEVGPGLGAARLAQLGVTGAFSQERLSAICPQPAELDRHEPNERCRDYHQSQRYRYRRLYELTHELTRPDVAASSPS
ncbi:MAG: xylulokinase [Proteobacteria bacterium]|nr:xylulokinase [Pseudomonadota bacterium]